MNYILLNFYILLKSMVLFSMINYQNHRFIMNQKMRRRIKKNQRFSIQKDNTEAVGWGSN